MSFSRRILRQPAALIITLALIVLAAFLVPIEKTLGANIRLIYVHAAWVWAGKLAFGLSAISGLLALIDDEDDDLNNDLDLDEEQAQGQPRKTPSSPLSPAKPLPAVSLVSEIENLKKIRDILKTRSLAIPVSAGPPVH
jgi:hypothetical protein